MEHKSKLIEEAGNTLWLSQAHDDPVDIGIASKELPSFEEGARFEMHVCGKQSASQCVTTQHQNAWLKEVVSEQQSKCG